MGAHLLDAIKERVLDRHHSPGFCKVVDLESDGITWITATVEYKADHSDLVTDRSDAYIKGVITGVLIWSGVDVI